MTDEAKIRELIADVQNLREALGGAGGVDLDRIERRLGALLPPIRGTFNVVLAGAGVQRRSAGG